RAFRDADGRAKLHADIAHPINSACREVVQTAVIKAYTDEREKAKVPGYVCTYDEYDAGEDFDGYASVAAEMGRGPVRAHGKHGEQDDAPPGRFGSARLAALASRQNTLAVHVDMH